MNQTAQQPYYAVIFTSQRSSEDAAGYANMAARMEQLAAQQPGYLGLESTRDSSGLGITISYWRDLACLQQWKHVREHQEAQALGKSKWYEWYSVKICRVEREHHSAMTYKE